jgi:hypothetical protein
VGSQSGLARSSVVPAALPYLLILAASSLQSYTPRHLADKILTSKAALEGERN